MAVSSKSHMAAASAVLDLDAVPGKLVLVDVEQRIIAANQRFAARVGLSLEALRGQPVADFLADSDAALLRQRLTDLRALPQRMMVPFDASLRTPDGRDFDVTCSLAPRHDAAGALIGASVLFVDCTVRKSAERAQEEYTHSLEQLYCDLEQRTNELSAAYADLHEARVRTAAAEELARVEQMKTAFIDVAAHELRTPVTLLTGVLDCLQREGEETVREHLTQSAQRSARRLSSVLNMALKLLAADRPELTGRFQPHSLRQLLTDAASDVAPFVELRGLTLRTEMPADLPPVEMDVSMMRDALINLLMNAIKFTPDGGEITLRAGLSEDQQSAWFAVTDTGLGIDDDDRPYIFERFFASFDTRHHSSGSFEFNTRGPGFGLALVRKFVLLHGGQVTVQTAAGAGSTFTVTWPRTQEQRQQGAGEPGVLPC